MKLAKRRPEVAARGTKIVIPPGLAAWMKRETQAGQSSCSKAEVAKT